MEKRGIPQPLRPQRIEPPPYPPSRKAEKNITSFSVLVRWVLSEVSTKRGVPPQENSEGTSIGYFRMYEIKQKSSQRFMNCEIGQRESSKRRCFIFSAREDFGPICVFFLRCVNVNQTTFEVRNFPPTKDSFSSSSIESSLSNPTRQSGRLFQYGGIPCHVQSRTLRERAELVHKEP